jgi:hypothetical protein
MQKSELYDDEEPEKASRPVGNEEILPRVPAPYGAPRGEIESQETAWSMRSAAERKSDEGE